MKQRILDYLVCPASRSALKLEISKGDGDDIIEGALLSSEGKRYPIRNRIPRFVTTEEYTASFGFEWNRHARIYFDDKDKHRIINTEAQLKRKLGLSQEKTKGKTVLDVGCGTGANGAAIANWGAREVFCVDLSSAVEAAFANTKDLSNVHVIQADLFNLPFKQEGFDIVYSMGVLHHTSDTEKAFVSLIPFLIKQGTISIWVYADLPDLGQRLSDRVRSITTRMNPRLLYALCWLAVPAYYVRKIPLLGKTIFHFLPPISMEPYWEDRVLDTFDWYSPTFQWKHTYPEVYGWFQKVGLTDIQLFEVPVSICGKKVN